MTGPAATMGMIVPPRGFECVSPGRNGDLDAHA